FDAETVAQVEALARRAAIEVANLLEPEERLLVGEEVFQETGPGYVEDPASVAARLGAGVRTAGTPGLAGLARLSPGGGPEDARDEPPVEKLRQLGTDLALVALKRVKALRTAVCLVGPEQDSLHPIGQAGSWPEPLLSGAWPLEEKTAADHAIRRGRSCYIDDTAQ